MTKFLLIFLSTFLLTSTSKFKTEPWFKIEIEKKLNHKNSLKGAFEKGELNYDIKLLEKNSICTLSNDSLFIECGTGVGYVGLHLEMIIHNDSIYVEAEKWSCTYSNYYQAKKVKAKIDKLKYNIKDSISIFIEAELPQVGENIFKSRDKLLIEGNITLAITDSSYTLYDKYKENILKEKNK